MLAVVAVLAGAFALGLMLVGFRYLTRGLTIRRVRRAGSAFRASDIPAVSDDRFARTAELITRAQLSCGNDVQLVTCGDELFGRLWADLEGARRSITVQMYYAMPGVVADRCRTLLRERARQGVQVLFLRDAFGAKDLGSDYTDSLCEAGVQVASFRPVHWWSLERAYARSHIRVAVIDGDVGYTGGFGLDDKWLGDGLTHGQWRDTSARFIGPAVDQLQASFAAGWCEATGTLLTGEPFFRARPPAEGGILAGLLHTSPTIGTTSAERLLALTIASARERLWITNSYFVPEDELCAQLEQAAARGVDVRILTAGRTNDVRATVYGARSVYERLLRAGIRIFEYQPTMHHGKTFVVDGRWCGIGTMNFDHRSLAFNDETTLLALDDGLGGRMDAMFRGDLARSTEVTLEAHRRRGVWSRVAEFGVKRVRRIL